jgi:mannose/fructose/N-acetylgalactosamine-specific phosphotransferase system component IIC
MAQVRSVSGAGRWMRDRVIGAPVLRLCALAGAVAIAALSLIPQGVLINAAGSDKIHHFLAYGLLTATATVAWPHRRSRIIVAALIVLFGCALEAMQTAVPGRFAEGLDVAANILGVGIGSAIGWALIRLLTKPSTAEL